MITLNKNLHGLANFCDSAASRITLGAVKVSRENNTVSVCATDGYGLVLYTRAEGGLDESALIPEKLYCQGIKQATARHPHTEVHVGENDVEFKAPFDGRTMKGQQIEGRFPRVLDELPPKEEAIATIAVNASLMASYLNGIANAVEPNGDRPRVVLRVYGNKIRIDAPGVDDGQIVSVMMTMEREEGE